MRKIEERIKSLFIGTDEKDWDMVKMSFADEVELDYSSMSGQPAAKLTPEIIVESWKGILPGFKYTHHQIGNMIIKADGDTASVFCYGTATHYLENEAGNVWTVVGTYDFDLARSGDDWEVSKMKFNFKYQDGNLTLPQAAMEALK